MINKFNIYKIQIIGSACRCIEVNGQQTTHFVAPDTESGIQKLYVVKESKDICYVGITSQPMSSRLRIGFIDYGHYGYHGYKWKDKLKQAELLVWAFPDRAKDNGKDRGNISTEYLWVSPGSGRNLPTCRQTQPGCD